MQQVMSDDYFPRDDESEAKRVQDLTGVGEPVNYLGPEASSFNLADYGLGIGEEVESG
jgi:hypothetical protein